MWSSSSSKGGESSGLKSAVDMAKRGSAPNAARYNSGGGGKGGVPIVSWIKKKFRQLKEDKPEVFAFVTGEWARDPGGQARRSKGGRDAGEEIWARFLPGQRAGMGKKEGGSPRWVDLEIV